MDDYTNPDSSGQVSDKNNLTQEQCNFIRWNVSLMEPLCSVAELRYFAYAYEDAARRKELEEKQGEREQ